nr:alginate lyase family protein [Pontibacter anaerobius]
MNSIRFICRHTLTDTALLSAVHGELNFLSGRVEYHLLANHVLENAFALLMGGAFFQQPEWHNMGREILLRELEEQVLGDGAHYELSPMYHQIILYRVLELIDWYQNYENPDNLLLERVCSKASLMLSWLRNMSFSNNDIPHVNDSAPSIAYDTASLLNYAASLQLEPMASVQLADSGYRKFDSGSYECVVDAAAIGPSYQAGHGHADALSFILYYKGSPVLVEAGTSTYEPGPRREYERSTGAHNTIEIQGANQSKVWGSFRVGYRANTTVVREEAGLLIAEHDGYVNRFGITHRRTFEFEASQITITDELLGEESMAGIAYFHLHPSVQYSLHHHMVSIPNICTVVFSDAVEYVEAGTYQFAEGFNSCCPSGVIKVAFKGKIITRIKFI